MRADLLTVKNLRAWYSDENMVLSDLSLELAGQETVGLIGLNGAGECVIIRPD